MMYRNSQKVHMNVTDMRLQRRVLLIACAVLLAVSVALGVVVLRSSGYRRRAETQFSQRMLSAASSAVDEVNRMSGIVTSNTASRLSRVRQYVYSMEQLNSLSMALAGGEAGRLAPDEAFTALDADLKAFEDLIQAGTTSTLDVRTTLLNHLTILQSILAGV